MRTKFLGIDKVLTHARQSVPTLSKYIVLSFISDQHTPLPLDTVVGNLGHI